MPHVVDLLAQLSLPRRALLLDVHQPLVEPVEPVAQHGLVLAALRQRPEHLGVTRPPGPRERRDRADEQSDQQRHQGKHDVHARERGRWHRQDRGRHVRRWNRMLPSGSRGVVVGVVVDALVVPVAQGDGVVEVGASAVGPGLSVVELAPGEGALAAVGGAGLVSEADGDPLGFGEEPGLAAEVEGDRAAVEDGGEDPGAAGEASGFAGGDGLAGVEAGGLEGPGEDGVVDGDHDGGGGPGVQVLGGQVLEELGERESAAVVPVEARRRRSRIRLGAVIESRILRRNAAAVLGTVKCPVVVPSPLSCRLNEHLDRAISSSAATRSFSWASTTAWSGSMVSIARRATRRSWSGSNRCAFSTREASTSPTLLGTHPVGQLLGRSDDHRRVRR